MLRELHATLKPRGVLFSSNPRGEGQEGWSGERYGAFHDLETWRGYMPAAGFAELDALLSSGRRCRASSSRGWRACGARYRVEGEGR